jgi:hypothetical protein
MRSAYRVLLLFPTKEQVPKYLLKHFIRGYIDGDGCLSLYKLIQKSFKKRQQEDSELSLRGLAEQIKISPGYLSKILAGKKPPVLLPHTLATNEKLRS